jgi:hypothetical protein
MPPPDRPPPELIDLAVAQAMSLAPQVDFSPGSMGRTILEMSIGRRNEAFVEALEAAGLVPGVDAVSQRELLAGPLLAIPYVPLQVTRLTPQGALPVDRSPSPRGLLAPLTNEALGMYAQERGFSMEHTGTFAAPQADRPSAHSVMLDDPILTDDDPRYAIARAVDAEIWQTIDEAGRRERAEHPLRQLQAPPLMGPAETYAHRVLPDWLPLESTPTITLDEIRNRRFAMIDRYGTNPSAEQNLGDMTLEEMEKIALSIRKTAWQRILADDDPF